MKNLIITLTLFLSLQTINSYAQSSVTPTKSKEATTIGIVIYSNDVETIWNALRLANYSKSEGDIVSIFLLGKGVELDSLMKVDTDLKEQSDEFINGGGEILGCGTCLISRNMNNPQVCKFSSMGDLYDLIRENKIVLTF